MNPRSSMKIVASFLILACAALGYLRGQDKASNSGNQSEVMVTGELESGNALQVRSTISGSIRSIVASGSQVKPGDTLVTLDTSELQSEINRARINYAKLQAAYFRARAALSKARLKMEAEAKLARGQRLLAKKAKKAYLATDGELAVQLKEVTAQIAEAKNKMNLAKSLAGTKVSRVQRKVFESEAKTARLKLEAAEARHAYMTNHVKPLTLSRLDLKIVETQMAEARMRETNASDLEIAKMVMKAADIELSLARRSMDALRRRMRDGSIQATRAGWAVVHQPPIGPKGQPLELRAGMKVRERQLVVQIADMKVLQIKTNLSEATVVRVKVGQTATVRFPAIPAKIFRGAVKSVARSPNVWHGSKRYAVTIALADAPPNAKLGMTAKVTIRTTAARTK